ncbi:barstar family protein [Clostridium saccharobutylicum]|uniref:Barstar (Barnase inhibitor) n=1 Tax=Clostridium saccharobutylicum TaxID=169679 RepID=A0A1S8NI01_CLOSA|nr:barstar family protein [Clostridium saccharobutylicum]OOM15891.1 barstar (barnase inhibitor) [Clostridium saccharobutylicum]
MKYKFSFRCDYELVGYCMDVIGLNADTVIVYNNEECHKVELIDFQVCEEYLEHLRESKSELGESCTIDVLDNEGISIGEYRVYVQKYIKYSGLSEMEKHNNLTLICLLNSAAVGNEIRLWDKWRCTKPNKKNEWVALSNEDRMAWLNIAMKYYISDKRVCNEPYKNIIGGTYYLDGSNITTYESFFCAFGEAMNGPGGYYGFNDSNILDCLTGGFRVCSPFKLIWKNSTVALENLTKSEWQNKIRRNKELYLRIFKDYTHSEPNHSFFSEIIEILIKHGVTIELEP